MANKTIIKAPSIQLDAEVDNTFTPQAVIQMWGGDYPALAGMTSSVSSVGPEGNKVTTITFSPAVGNKG